MLLRRYKQQAEPVKEVKSEEQIPAEQKPEEKPKAKVSRKK
jgi:hypothetical protein